MVELNYYEAIAKEVARGTSEPTAIGFFPVVAPSLMDLDPQEEKRGEFRGEDRQLGARAYRRFSTKISGSQKYPFFIESGTVKGMVVQKFLQLIGKESTGNSQNGTTGQYFWALYPQTDPFHTDNLGNIGLTRNINYTEEATVKNHPHVGCRPTGVTIESEVGQPTFYTMDYIGQTIATPASAIASPAFTAESELLRYNHLTLYTGAGVSRTGTGPNFSALDPTAMTAVTFDKLSIRFEESRTDKLQHAGVTYPTRTKNGIYSGQISITLDFEDPSSGFSSVDEFNNWIAGLGTTNFFAHWDTGVTAGTAGLNYQLLIDMPLVQRIKPGNPSFPADTDPDITIKYEMLFDATTTQYMFSMAFINEAATI